MGLAEGSELQWALSALALTEARLNLLRCLSDERERTLVELQDDLGLSGTTLRWHLKHLAESGLVSSRRVHRAVGGAVLYWRIVPGELARLRQLSAQLL